MSLFLLVIFLVSFILTAVVRAYSLRKAILDIPNERSSHTVPTPRGGGIAIAIAFFIGIGYLGWQGLITMALVKALLGGGVLVAATGYWDDLRSLSAKFRIIMHFLAAFWAIYCIGGMTSFAIGNWNFHMGWMGSIFAALGIVWFINLYNFMDGIDGIAGSETLFVSAAASILFYIIGSQNFALLCWVLCAATAGFLLWNWPPAKIFLGDVGSGLLGFIFAVLALASAKQHALSLLPWFILLALFIFDATFTLLHRMKRKQRLYEAHRDHIYQRLNQCGASHKKIVLWMLAINVIVLLPIFLLAVFKPNFSLELFLVCLGFFVVLWRRIVLASQFNRT